MFKADGIDSFIFVNVRQNFVLREWEIPTGLCADSQSAVQWSFKNLDYDSLHIPLPHLSFRRLRSTVLLLYPHIVQASSQPRRRQRTDDQIPRLFHTWSNRWQAQK